MRRPAIELTPSRLAVAARLASGERDYIMGLAKNLADDPRKEKRLEAALCVVCYYKNGRLGGAAVTLRNCGGCGVEMTFGSTATDALCMPCAQEKSLCRWCVAPLDLGLTNPG